MVFEIKEAYEMSQASYGLKAKLGYTLLPCYVILFV